MTNFGKSVLLVATLATAAAAALLGWANDWRYWPTPLAAPIALLVVMAVLRPRQAGGIEAPAEMPTPTQHFRDVLDRDTSVANVPVPSASVNYMFLLSATVHWRPSPTAPSGINSASPGTLACNTIIERATEQTAVEDPAAFIQAQHRLAAVLANVQDDSSESLKVWATDVTLSMRPDDLDRLRRLDELNKQKELWEQKLAIEREASAYFSEEVFKDPGSAVAWWMAKHHERTHEEIERAVDLIGPLAQLAAAANNEELPEAFRRFVDPLPASAGPTGPEIDSSDARGGEEYSADHASWEDDPERPFEPQTEDPVSGFLDRLGFAPESTERMRFARQLAEHCEQAGKHDVAARIREACNLRDFSTVAATEPTPYDDHGTTGEPLWQ